MDEKDKFWADFLDDCGDLRLSDLNSDENSLTHYGRKGMKWYQRIFSKLKEIGKASMKGQGWLPDSKNPIKKRLSERKAEKASQTRKKPKRIPLKKLSDQELEDRLKRLRKEKEYKDLSRETRNRGMNVVIDILEKSAKRSMTEVLSNAMTKKVENIFNEKPVSKKKNNKENKNSDKKLNELVKERKKAMNKLGR